MKKILFICVGLVGFFYLGFALNRLDLHAAPTEYTITFQSMFDADNLGTPVSLGTRAYHTTIQLETNVIEAVSPSGEYVFAFWVVNGIVRKDLPVSHTFVIIGDMDIIAVFSKVGENAVLFMDSNAKLIAAQYVLDGQDANDSSLSLPDKPGYIVHTSEKWRGSLTNITDDIVLILQYEKSTPDTFILSVTGGTGSGTYGFNEVVTVIADVTETPFSHWIDQDGIILSTESEYAFSMLSAVEVTAVYSATPEDDISRITLSEDLEIRSAYRTYLAQFYIPIGYKLIDYGMLTLTEDKPIVDFETSNVFVHRGFKYFNETKEFVMSFPTGSIYSIRAYLVVEDESGVLHRYYSEKNIQYYHMGPVNLRSAYYFAILSSSGISTTGVTHITGNVGLSPAAELYITGFSLTKDASNEFSTSLLVDGFIYAADYAAPTPAYLTTAVGDMGTAYTDAASRTPDFVNLHAGDISGQTLEPGVYFWSTGLLINTELTLNGSATDVWIFQISGNVGQAADVNIILTGGAVAENIVWQIAGLITIGARAHFEGTILCATSVHLGAGATLNGRILAQTATTLDANKINE